MDWLIHVFLLMTATKTADASDGRSSICNTKDSTRFVVQMDDYNENRIGGEYWVDKDLITLRCNAPSKPSGQVHWMELKSRSWGPAARPGNDTLVLPQTSGAHIAKEAARYVCLVWSSDVKELATSNVITIRYPYMDKNIVNQCSSDGCASCSYPTIPDKLLQNRVEWSGNSFIQSNMTSDKMQLCINPSDFSAFGYATCTINAPELWPSARYASDIVLFEYKFSALENCSAKSPSQPSPLPAADYIADFEVCDERILDLAVSDKIERLLGEGTDSTCYDNKGNVYKQNMSYDIETLVGYNQAAEFLCCDLTIGGYGCRQTQVTFQDPCELADCSNGCVIKADKAECVPGNPGMVGIIVGIVVGSLVALACLYLVLKAFNNKKVKVGLDKDAKVARNAKNPDVKQTAVYTRQMMRPTTSTMQSTQPPTPTKEVLVSPSADVKEGRAGKKKKRRSNKSHSVSVSHIRRSGSVA